MRPLRTLLLLPTLVAAAAAQAPAPRLVQAPPEDLLTGLLSLPEPAACATASSSALRRVRLERGRDGALHADLELPLHGGPTTLAWVAQGPLELRAVDASGRPRDLRAEATDLRREELPAPFAGHLGERLLVPHLPTGTLRLHLSAEQDPGPVLLIVRDGSDARAEAWVDDLRRTADVALPLRARLVGGRARSARFEFDRTGHGPLPLPVELFDDGAHGDGAAGDGLLGGELPPGLLGYVVGRVVVEGDGPQGPLERGVPLALHLHLPGARLVGGARARVDGPDGWTLDLLVESAGIGQRVQLGAEVWGHDALGRPRPLCWLGRIERVRPGAGFGTLSLELDADWLVRAGARPPLELRAVRLLDPDTHGLLDLQARVPVTLAGRPAGLGAPALTLGPIATGGFVDAAPPSLAPPPSANPALLLVHGYCSGGTPWPVGDFSGPLQVFFDPNQNRSHDAFAQELAAQAVGRTSFGVVAHSQGGPAALHLRTYYASPLDAASGGRRIQSLASPYQGTPLASLGSFACGVNNDMTPGGAATWLAGIPGWARDEVWFWTTSDGGSACNFFTGLLLSNPEDGTVEVARCQLPGAHAMGNTAGWCHTTGMSYPAGYQDAARNAALDAAAAR